MFWKCHGATFYEDAMLESTDGSPSLSDEKNVSFLDNELEKNPFDRCRNLTSSFVQRDIGHQEDALSAVTGVLNNIGKAMDTQFLCGLPESHLEVCLLWQFKNLKKDIQDLREPHFPSWSWIVNASVNGHASFWDAATSVSEYSDSHYRLHFQTHNPAKLCSMIRAYKYDAAGTPSPVNSKVFWGDLDKFYRNYLKHEGPPTIAPMLRFRWFNDVSEYRTLTAEFQRSPTGTGMPLHQALQMVAPRTIGFIARQAYFYVSTTPKVDNDEPQQEFAVAWDKNFNHVVGHVLIDKSWKDLGNDSLLFVPIARRLSEGPHLYLPRKMGWYFHCLVVERAFSEELVEAGGIHARFFYRKVSVFNDLHCEDFEMAEPFSCPLLLV
jgi:hypothetical protein